MQLLSILLIPFILAIRKWDWINNYNALPCTCLSQCCLYGQFRLTNDEIMNEKFVLISGKLQGDTCSNYTINSTICYFTDPTSVQTTLTCPEQSWTWSISKDNNTGSVYWTDNNQCQGVWNVIDLDANTIKYVNGQLLIINIILIFIII